MGKSRRSDREYTKEQRLVKENKQLKQMVAQLRKQLARLDLDRYDTMKEIVEEHYKEDKAEEGKYILDVMKKEWSCKESNCSGHLEIVLYTRRDGTHYYRACSECKNRTKSQKYDPISVKGIIKK